MPPPVPPRGNAVPPPLLEHALRSYVILAIQLQEEPHTAPMLGPSMMSLQSVLQVCGRALLLWVAAGAAHALRSSTGTVLGWLLVVLETFAGAAD